MAHRSVRRKPGVQHKKRYRTAFTSNMKQYRQGYNAGYAEGMKIGKQSFHETFEGTSIIIPTYNQREMLLRCIESIEAYTTMPYEIIVVDNGSTDGTAEELRKRRGALRLSVHPQNLGFARAVNTGLMLAKGTTLAILNNDVLVTEGWLDQLLHCLRKCPNAAVVGPVTNYIGGEQLIQVSYPPIDRSSSSEEIAVMQEFAARYNRPDEAKWRYTDRLVGFCMLFSRNTFEEVGYLDEGYELGNFEDDDWVVRLRLQGKRMVIAGDTFVHHYGSITMKGLGEQGFSDVNGRNRQYFIVKWAHINELIQENPDGLEGSKSTDYYPSHVWITGGMGKIFWLRNGVKHPVIGEMDALEVDAVVQLSVIDLLQIPTGEPCMLTVSGNSLGDEPVNGSVLRADDGRLYQIVDGRRREILSSFASERWGLKPVEASITLKEYLSYPPGLPIIPPPILKSEDL